jgi:poly-gamma-glutamate synthesis protein (capsule biosynthesis protein)
VLERFGFRLAVLGLADHPAAFAAEPDRAGIAYADLQGEGVGNWVADALATARSSANAVLVAPHWGPNMTVCPAPYIRRAARALLLAGATLVAGHSAHVIHGAERRVLYDLGDFLDDYRVDRRLRNDLGLLFLVDLDARGPRRLEAVPLELEDCHTRLARRSNGSWIRQRFINACAELGTQATEDNERVIVTDLSS